MKLVTIKLKVWNHGEVGVHIVKDEFGLPHKQIGSKNQNVQIIDVEVPCLSNYAGSHKHMDFCDKVFEIVEELGFDNWDRV